MVTALVTVCCIVAFIGVAAIFASRYPENAGATIGGAAGVLALLGLSVQLALQWLSERRITLESTANELALAVEKRWREEAKRRKIGTPSTISISWRRSTRDSSDVRAIADIHRPLELPPTRSRHLLDDALIKELDTLYRKSPSGKVVVIGMPGAGKTGVLIQMLLEALRYRNDLPPEQRYDAPVPVLLTLSDWVPAATPDSDAESLIAWASRVLRDDFSPALTSAGTSVYRTLLEDRRIALFLDGLEEMPEANWDALAKAIADSSRLRVVLTARPRAALSTYVPDADRVRLEHIDTTEAGRYLVRACDKRLHPHRWERLASFMRDNPASVAAAVLTTPLMLTLALNSYDRPGTDPDELSQPELFPKRSTMEQFLVGQIIPVAYGSEHVARHGVSPRDAEIYLAELANHMGDSRDLRWWRVRRWCPWLPPALIGATFLLAVGAVAGALGGASVGFAIGAPAAVVAALIAGGTAALATRHGSDEIKGLGPRLGVSCTVGVLFGVCLGLIPQIEAGRISGLAAVCLGCAFGAMGGTALGFLALHDGPLVAQPKRVTPRDVLFGLPTGATTGTVYGLITHSWQGVPVGVIAGIGFMVGVAWTRPSDRPDEGATPHDAFRRDLRGGALIGSVIGLTVTTLVSILYLERHGPVTAIFAAIATSVPFAALTGAAASQSCALIVVTAYLRLLGKLSPHTARRPDGLTSGRLDGEPQPTPYPWTFLWLRGESGNFALKPGQRAAGFLEDARSRLILRSAGTRYQFRHARLQDLLRGIPWSDDADELEAYERWDEPSSEVTLRSSLRDTPASTDTDAWDPYEE